MNRQILLFLALFSFLLRLGIQVDDGSLLIHQWEYQVVSSETRVSIIIYLFDQSELKTFLNVLLVLIPMVPACVQAHFDRIKVNTLILQPILYGWAVPKTYLKTVEDVLNHNRPNVLF